MSDYDTKAQARIKRIMAEIFDVVGIKHAAVSYEGEDEEIFTAGSKELPTLKDFYDRVAKECLACDLTNLRLMTEEHGKIKPIIVMGFVHDGIVEELVNDWIVYSSVSEEDEEAISAILGA